LARGEPVERIARQLHTSKHTVISLREQEWNDIARRKQLIIANAARLAANGFDKLNDEMDAGNIKGQLLVPVTGMAIDKVIALSGDANPPLTNVNLNFQRVDLVAQFNKINAALKQLPAKEKASGTRHQLAVPDGEAIADSGAETGPEARKKTVKNGQATCTAA
jgi:hypothetical protein